MDESTIKATLAGLIKKVEALEAENAALRSQARLEPAVAPKTTYRKRPSVLRGRTVQSNVGCGPLYITLNEDDQGRPFEVFFKLGKSGSCQQSYLEALGVAISVGLRYGADPQKFIEKFEGMRCPNPKMRDASGPSTLSCADGISQGLAKALTLALPIADVEARGEAHVVSVAEPQFALAEEELAKTASGSHSANGAHPSLAPAMPAPPSPSLRKAMMSGVGMCPKCGGNLVSQGGCIQCLQQCGYVGRCS